MGLSSGPSVAEDTHFGNRYSQMTYILQNSANRHKNMMKRCFFAIFLKRVDHYISYDFDIFKERIHFLRKKMISIDSTTIKNIRHNGIFMIKPSLLKN
jgi:hypothetical protein